MVFGSRQEAMSPPPPDADTVFMNLASEAANQSSSATASLSVADMGLSPSLSRFSRIMSPRSCRFVVSPSSSSSLSSISSLIRPSRNLRPSLASSVPEHCEFAASWMISLRTVVRRLTSTPLASHALPNCLASDSTPSRSLAHSMKDSSSLAASIRLWASSTMTTKSSAVSCSRSNRLLRMSDESMWMYGSTRTSASAMMIFLASYGHAPVFWQNASNSSAVGLLRRTKLRNMLSSHASRLA